MKIRLELNTTRYFNSKDELFSYLRSMTDQGVYREDFWSDLWTHGIAAFSSMEPINKTIITTTGKVSEVP